VLAASIPWWGAPLFTLLAGVAGVIVGQAFSLLQDKRQDHRRLEDLRRDSYGTAIEWLMKLRDKIYSLNTFLYVADQGGSSDEQLSKLREIVDERWTEVSSLVVETLPEEMSPLLRVCSERVMEAYTRLRRNATFWPSSYSDHVQVPLDDDANRELDKQWRRLRYRDSKEWNELLRQRLERPTRDRTEAETLREKNSASRRYLKQLDGFIHLLRQEVGLSSGHSYHYLTGQDRPNLRARLYQLQTQVGRSLVRIRHRPGRVLSRHEEGS
jgi:hypothetical protein